MLKTINIKFNIKRNTKTPILGLKIGFYEMQAKRYFQKYIQTAS